MKDQRSTDSEPEHYDHVIYVVHGMGKPAAQSLKRNVETLSKTAKEVLQEEYKKQANIKWIPIEWYDLLHKQDSVDQRMQSITIPSCTLMRQVCNEILADVLFYFTSFHGQRLINIVTKNLNERHAEFLKENPEFKGKVGFLGHSLGGVIFYDILAHQSNSTTPKSPSFPTKTTHFQINYPKLDFMPDFLMLLGSQIAAVMVMRGQIFSEYRIPIRLYNVFNLYDPLAYRLEPLMDERYAEISPILWQRPSAKNGTFQSSYYKELVAAYLPSINFSNQFSQFRIPSFPESALKTLGIPLPALPAIPILADMQKVMSDHFSSIYESVPKLVMPKVTKTTSDTKSDNHKPNLKRARPQEEHRASDDEDLNLVHRNKRLHRDRTAKPQNHREHATNPTSPSIIDTAMGTFWPFTSKLASQAEKNDDLGEELTKKLVDAAKITQEKVPKTRHDFFVRPSALMSLHEYFNGLSAHFAYWDDKDIMYNLIHILEHGKPGQ